MALHRKSSPGFFVHPDRTCSELSGNSGSGGESDSSHDSFINSARTVNFPLGNTGSSLAKSVEASQDRMVRSNSLLQSILSVGKRRKLATIPISQSELIDRLKKVLILAIDLAVYTGMLLPSTFSSKVGKGSSADVVCSIFSFTHQMVFKLLTKQFGP